MELERSVYFLEGIVSGAIAFTIGYVAYAITKMGREEM